MAQNAIVVADALEVVCATRMTWLDLVEVEDESFLERGRRTLALAGGPAAVT